MLGGYFMRCSKSMIINLQKIRNVKSQISGRIDATLINDEVVVISRGLCKGSKEEARNRMNKMKLWLEQTMTISFAIFVGIMLEGVVYVHSWGMTFFRSVSAGSRYSLLS